MSYYTGLELTRNGMRLINIKKKKNHYYIQDQVFIPLEHTVCSGEGVYELDDFKYCLERVFNNKRFKGRKLGILIPPIDVIRRTIKVPIFMKRQIKSYIHTNKEQLLPLAAESFAIDFKACNEQPDREYMRYQIRATNDTLLMQLTTWLMGFGFRTVAITTIGDTLQDYIPTLNRQGRYCVLVSLPECCYIIFYEGRQCAYCHTIEHINQEETSWAWEIFKVIGCTNPYGDGESSGQVVCLGTEALNRDIIDELEGLMHQEVEYMLWHTPLEYAGLMGLIYQMSKGRKSNESLTSVL